MVLRTLLLLFIISMQEDVGDTFKNLSESQISEYSSNYNENNFSFVSTTDIINPNEITNIHHSTGNVPGKILRRGKRYLDFTKGTRISWRTTIKNNILKVNTLWGYGSGFRVNFPFSDKEDRRRPFFKRDVLHAVSDVLDGHGLDGRACLLKCFCMAFLDVTPQMGKGMLFKLLQVMFRVGGNSSENLSNANRKESFANNEIIGNSSVEPFPLLRRGKRFLDFLETSRLFFRINCKLNIIPLPAIWAHSYGFRANLPIENDKKYRPFRRDTYEILHDLIQKQGFDGEACALKAYCSAHLDAGEEHQGPRGMLFKLMRYIFTLDADDKRHFSYLNLENCEQILHSHCPLSFNNISPYTDDV